MSKIKSKAKLKNSNMPRHNLERPNQLRQTNLFISNSVQILSEVQTLNHLGEAIYVTTKKATFEEEKEKSKI